ncbi:unnamed protein product [Prunus brigantina]
MEKIARSTTIPWWDAEMKNMRQLSQAAFDWVAALDPSQWCRAHFKTHSKRWDITGIPCKHACAAIGQLNGDHIAYVDACYKKEAFMRAYSPMVHPMTSEDLWPKCHRPPLMPPLYHKQPGRPRKKRMRSAGE